MKKAKIKDTNIALSTGQIMSRKKVDSNTEEATTEVKVLLPKFINEFGTIDFEAQKKAEEGSAIVTEKDFKKFVNGKNRKVTKAGDIVAKLCPSYNACLIDEKSAGWVIPSFCAILTYDSNEFDPNYLLAFFNSDYYKDAIKEQVSDKLLPAISIGKIGEVEIPIPSLEEQKKIGEEYLRMTEKQEILKRLAYLESQKNNSIFEELGR